jgi:phage-related protein
MGGPERQVIWLGDAKKQLLTFPEAVRRAMGYALHLAQYGERHPQAKTLKGHKEFSGGVVVEVVEDSFGDTYRAVYTSKIGNAIYVLHAFQKKSKHGIATPRQDIDLIISRLKAARAHAQKEGLS